MQHEGVKPAAGLTKVVLAASAGTVIEWYDFFIFGSLSTVVAQNMFPNGKSGAALLSTLGTFALGFLFRPLGAVVFGRMGDMLGRKHTFLLTLLMMGFSTAAIGLVPGFDKISYGAPALLVLLRIIQGLALGGQYGGAALYIAEHAPDNRRGYYTSFLQTTATIGLLISILLIISLKAKLGEADFNAWGWRIPFLLSSVLVIFSYLIRRRMSESPAFAALQAEGGVSKNPLKESFANPVNRNLVLIALFGLTAGQGVVWYTAQFYVNLFMTTQLNLNASTANQIVAWALVFGTPFFVLFGALSDRIGRKRLIMAGLALSVIAYIPVYKQMVAVAGVDIDGGAITQKAAHVKDPKTGIMHTLRIVSITDDAHRVQETTYHNDPVLPHYAQPTDDFTSGGPKVQVLINKAPSVFWQLVALVFIQILFVTMVYGPTAAFLVEMFPVKLRYTSMSVPYHIGNGVFGGMVPFLAVLLVQRTNNQLAGLLYPIAVAVVTLVVGSYFIHENKHSGDSVIDEDEDAPPVEAPTV